MTDPLIGSTTAVFSIALSVALLEPVDVGWSTKDGTAKAGTDYEAASGVVTFLPGELEKQIEVTVYGQDVGATLPKNFYIKLTPPTNAILNTPLVECVITVEDDQGTPITSLIVAQGKRGLKGDPGLSAYEQAVIMGYTGTIEDWMNDIANASHAADRAEDALTEVEANAAKAEAAASAAAFAGRIFQTPAAGVDPIIGVPNGYYFNVRSPLSEHYIDEYQNVIGVAVATGKSFPSSQFVQTISDYTALPFVAGKAYVINQRVQLANGDIVKSTLDGNTNDPNIDMTGWVFDDDSVASVDALRLLNPQAKGRKVFLLSYRQDSGLGGGDFVATQKVGLTDNGVTVFSSPNPAIFWVRTNYDILTPEMAGAYVDNVQDDTFAFDRIKAVTNSIQLGEKTYLVNIVFTNFFNLKGISSKKSILKAFDKTKPVIKNMNTYPSWEYSSVECLQLHGSGTKEGIGFCYGDENIYSVNASYIGRVKFKDVYTSNFDKHIAKFWGNIGNIYDNVSMDTGNYGYYSRGAQIKDPQADLMHAGCDLLLGGHVARMDKMGMLILDKTGGAGQWTLINTVFEVNAGGAIYLDLEMPYSTLWCPIVLQNVWYELNATLPTVTIDNKDGGTSTIVPNGRFAQNGGVYPAFIELGSQSKFGTTSEKGAVNIWGNEGNDAISVFGGRIGTYDYSQIGFYSDSDPALTKGASIRSDRFSSSFGRTLSMYSGDGMFLYGGQNRNVVIGHSGAIGTFIGSADVLTLAGADDVPEGGITHRFKAGYGAATHIYQTSSDGSNAAATAIRIPTNTTTGRSINAGGTVNASGADYAEYMYKSAECPDIAKGEVVGVDVEGKLTKVYDDAISFVVKSTDPSIVGGDIWFNESFDENEPTNTFDEVLSEDASADEIDQFNTRRDSYTKKLEADILEYKERLKSFNDRLEVERQKVDRIAFCGQVPIAYEANSGDYIIPLRNTDGSIGIETTKQPTFEQHLKCVGKVWKVIDSVPYIVVFNN